VASKIARQLITLEHVPEAEDAGVGNYPLLEGGVAAPIKQMERYLRFGAAGEVKHLLQQGF
jgi:hypothetical protein